MPVQFDFVWSTRYSPVFLWVCLALSCPDVFIKDYYLSLLLVSMFLVPPSCVHRDNKFQFGLHNNITMHSYQNKLIKSLYAKVHGMIENFQNTFKI